MPHKPVRGVPAFLRPQQPKYVKGRPFDGDFVPPGQADPPTPDTSLIKLFGLLWVEFNPGQPGDFTQYQSRWVFKGFNWAIWESALNTRITARGGTPSSEIFNVSGNRVELSGEVCIDLASMFDVVALGDWLPEVAITAIKARSTAPNGTQVLLLDDFESIGQKRPALHATNAAWTALRPDGILTATANVYGDFSIDEFEDANQVGGLAIACPHSPLHSPLVGEAVSDTLHRWDINIWDATVQGTSAAAIIETAWRAEIDGAYPVVTIDGVLLDRVLEVPEKGQATTDYPGGWPAQYLAGWRAFMDTWQALTTVPALWGNAPLSTEIHTVERLPNRYVEHFFLDGQTAKTLEEIRTDLQRHRYAGTTIVLSVRSSVADVDDWATTSAGPTASNATWQQLVQEIRANAPAATYVACWQTESLTYGLGEAFAFWQSGFRTPT
jgi:hypothetical protein